MRWSKLARLLGALALTSQPARAEGAREFHVFDHARQIPRSRSASRDAPAFGAMMAPRGIRTASAEFALVVLPVGPITLRPAFYGLLELEGDGDARFKLWASQDIRFWRGAFAFPLAISLDSLSATACAGCAFELGLQFRHESEHYTGPNDGGSVPNYSDRAIYGDAFATDFGASATRGDFFGLARAGLDVFVPQRSTYALGASVDSHLRYLAWSRLQPFLSVYGEYRLGTSRGALDYPDWYLVRGLAGVAFPSELGDLMLFLAADTGYRMGLAAYTRESTLGMGVRFALGPLPQSSDRCVGGPCNL